MALHIVYNQNKMHLHPINERNWHFLAFLPFFFTPFLLYYGPGGFPKWVKFEFMWRDGITVTIWVGNYVYRNSFRRIRLILCGKSTFYPFSSPFWDKKRAWDLKSPFGNEHPNFSQSTHPILWTSAEKPSKAWLFYGTMW